MGGVEVERRDSVALVTFENAGKANAIDRAMATRLTDALTTLDRDPAVRCVVLTAPGRVFCSGHDIDEVSRTQSVVTSPDEQNAFTFPSRMHTPCIAAINGPAVAAGMILAISCDIRIASQEVTFSNPASAVGLIPLGGQLGRMLYMLPVGVVMPMLLAGAALTAERAFTLGFVTEVVPREDLIDTSLRWARTVSRQSASTNAAMKRIINNHLETATRRTDDIAYKMAGSIVAIGEWREGFAAQSGHRKPEFAGTHPQIIAALEHLQTHTAATPPPRYPEATKP